jgi:ketosteroid isomerase-like protein
MSENNKAILEKANAAITQGDNEGFLSFCTEDTEWTFVGDKTLRGKEAVRQWMATAYVEPPKFIVAHLIAEGDFVTALGNITMKDEDGTEVDYSYCDVWRFRDGKMAELKAFVIRSADEGEKQQRS